MRWLSLLVLAAAFVAFGHSARILAIFPFVSKSHILVLNALTTELSKRGHEMVVISAFPQSKKMPNYTDIDLMPGLKEVIENGPSRNLFEVGEMPFYMVHLTMWVFGYQVTEAVANTPQFLSILQDKKGFDLVIAEIFMNEAFYGLAHHFKAPLVLVCPFGGFHFHSYSFANPIPLSFYPNPSLEYSDRMSFIERLTNFLYTKSFDLGYYLYSVPKQDALSKKIFGADTPHVTELESNAVVVLVNQHFTLNYPRPLMPSIIEVGGMHVSREVKPLDKEFKDFLDGAKEGAIYFSMGSNLKSELMGEERIKAFVDAFSEMPQRVLWKWESDKMPGKPDNLKVAAWMPQQEILAHPNVQVFITHGGLLSAQEAAFHGVTLIGIPIFGDQKLNMRRAQLGGFGILLDFHNITKDSIKWALNEAIHNKEIKEAARQRSLLYRDQPEPPLDRAVYWVEYALRHKSSKHLRSAGADLNWVQLGMWDVYAALLAPFVFLYWLCRRCCSKRGQKQPPAAVKEKTSVASKKKKQ